MYAELLDVAAWVGLVSYPIIAIAVTAFYCYAIKSGFVDTAPGWDRWFEYVRAVVTGIFWFLPVIVCFIIFAIVAITYVISRPFHLLHRLTNG